MAETVKKYLSLDKLGKYDAKIKKVIADGDAATLASAQTYADSLASNYDTAGAAATALQDAKTYADGKDAAIAAAKKAGTDAQADVDALELKVGTVKEGETVVGLIGKAQSAADTAQSEVDALEGLVGVIPESSTAETIVAYIDEKTTGIATDEALNALTQRVGTAESAIDVIEADYLKSADKTELQGNIDAEAAKITTLIGSDAGKSVRAIANEEMVAQLIPEVAKESLDTLAEIAAWIQEHPEDASAMNQAIADIKALVGTIPEEEGIDATTIVAYIKELVGDEATRATGVESGLAGRITTLEGKFTGEGSVESLIATAKTEAITEATQTAASDATTKANKALTDAKSYADGLNTTMDGRVDALEATTHTHSNKALLDTYTQTEADLADAVSKKHSHTNATVLAGITSEKVTAWDTVGSKASQTDLTAEIQRATAAEQANAAAIAAFVEISEAEINALFTAPQA